MSREELERTVASVASMFKLTVGVANNCAINIMLDAHDKVKHHPAYKHRVKMLYKQALKEWHAYEAALLYAKTNRFFCVDDMGDRTRKKYGNITDRQYFDFWKGLGAEAYIKSRPMVTSLWNKYRVSLVKHNAHNANELAWGMTGSACLSLAGYVYEEAITQAVTAGVPKVVADNVFGQFSLAKVLKIWNQALDATDMTVHYELDDIERRNIEMGILQLAEIWGSPDVMYNSTMAAVEDYDEIFRTKGEQKKTLREISEVRDKTYENLKNEQTGERQTLPTKTCRTVQGK